jgi:thioredoxin-like negative regulator of GroEL
MDTADLEGMDGLPAYVEFTHPLCSECHDWERRLTSEPEPLLTLDVSERPDLARKYGVAVVPTVLKVAPDGAVLERLAP